MNAPPRGPALYRWASRERLLALCFAALGLGACSGPITGLPIEPGDAPIPPGDPAYATTLQIRYLGAGGVLLKRGEDALLAAPFFSNPSMLRVAFGEVRWRKEEVDRFLGPKDRDDLAAVSGVIVGHAHYDHLMDLPYIKQTYLPKAKIYGSDTARNTLLGDETLKKKPEDLVSVEHQAWAAPPAGQPEPVVVWTQVNERIRFLALKSEHAPIFLGIKFFEGHYREPLPVIPTSAWAWREGETLAYLIDFLGPDGKTVEFRVHYQDTASNPPLGFPPPSVVPPDGRGVDVAILCVPGHTQVKGYPAGIVERLRPRLAVLIHWEDFFAPLPDDPRDLRTVALLQGERFIEALEPALNGAPYRMPAPGTWLRYAR